MRRENLCPCNRGAIRRLMHKRGIICVVNVTVYAPLMGLLGVWTTAKKSLSAENSAAARHGAVVWSNCRRYHKLLPAKLNPILKRVILGESVVCRLPLFFH